MIMPQPKYSHPFILAFFLVLLFLAPSLRAAELPSLTRGQRVYIPAYSNIYHGNREDPLLLAVTLSIRNVDPNNALTITAVNYHATHGPLVKEYIKAPVVLAPLGSARFIVPHRDNTGGSGANFIVEWHADKPINPPIMESVMISTQSQLGISFTSRGQAIQ